MSLDKELNFYKENRDSLVEKYEGKFIVVVGNEVIDAFETLKGAVEYAGKQYTPGTFLIKQVLKKEKPLYFHSRVCIGNG